MTEAEFQTCYRQVFSVKKAIEEGQSVYSGPEPVQTLENALAILVRHHYNPVTTD